jgi:hypothetical protein
MPPNMSPTDAILGLLGLYMVYLPVVWVIVSLIQSSRHRHRPRPHGAVVEIWLRNYMLFCIGIMFVMNFIYHTAFAQLSASFIGWANSPFQIEVGTASLGMGLVGFLAYVRTAFLVRLAAWLGTAPFLWGAAVGHIIDIIRTQNYAPGNAGFVLYLDILLPAAGLLLLVLAHRHRDVNVEAAPQPARL